MNSGFCRNEHAQSAIGQTNDINPSTQEPHYGPFLQNFPS